MRGLKVLRHVVTFLEVMFFPVLIMHYLQHIPVHRQERFVPDYSMVELTEETDAETFLMQTGLGEAAVERLIEEDRWDLIWDAQQSFFATPETTCRDLLGWFTKEERVKEAPVSALVDLQPGDILLTLSTHSAGWRHGHAGLVIDENTVLECGVWGQDSALCSASNFETYASYAHLRVKGATEETRKAVAEYAVQTLNGVPYHLSAGFLGPKAPEPTESYFGLQCAYLVWYAWQEFGVDLDADGGRLVVADDLLASPYLEIVQVYGMEPF